MIDWLNENMVNDYLNNLCDIELLFFIKVDIF